MIIKVLGSAAGGGSPQWNCSCSVCESVRRDPGAAPRLTCTMAIGTDPGRWFLCNAGPDLGVQLRDHPPFWPGPDRSPSPIQGVLLTDAELDHTAGLLALRQAHHLRLHATTPVWDLMTESGLLPTLSSYTSVEWCEVRPGEDLVLSFADGEPSPLTVRAFPVGTGRLPRFARTTSATPAAVIGYVVEDTRTGGRAAIAPSIPTDDDAVGRALGEVHLAFIDGTFWSDDEMHREGRGDAAARSMGHVSVGTSKLGAWAAAGGARVVYTHLNNTNRMILSDSPERELVINQGFAVAHDGMEFVL